MDRPDEDSTVINSLTQLKLCHSKFADNTGSLAFRANSGQPANTGSGAVSRVDLGGLPPHFANPLACLG
jgi:hypothetical protein